MKSFSRFDIAMIVAFLVVALLGSGGAYYLDAYQLADAQSDVGTANDDFKQYSQGMPFLPTRENLKILQGNIDLVNGQIDPVVKTILQGPGNKLADQVNENTVDWKHKLDREVTKLNAAAKIQGVQVPGNYYYAFSSYLSEAPTEAKTGVLSKQLLAIEEMANVMIGAPVNAIKSIRRTAEEDSGAGPPGQPSLGGDFMSGHSVRVAGGIYTVYPFEIEFDATTDSLRKVVNGLMQSPYVFIIRGVSVENSQPSSPQLGDLDKIVGAQPAPSVIDSPGAVAATKSTAGPQYIFGSEILHVRIRLDLVEWRGLASDAGDTGGKPAGKPGSNSASPPAAR